MQTNFLQPDPNTCVPTSFTYLLHKLGKADFATFLPEVVERCYACFDLEKDGMEFDQMQIIAREFGFEFELSKSKPKANAFLAGVSKLPKRHFIINAYIQEALDAKSLILHENYFSYPFGHAVTVFEKDQSTYAIFDSFFGDEREIDVQSFNECLEKRGEYLHLK